MKIQTIREMLGGDEGTLVDLNDWAVNTVREYATANDYDAAALVAEEALRIERGGLDLEGYRTVRRTGSHFRLSRVVRGAVFAIIATRKALRS